MKSTIILLAALAAGSAQAYAQSGFSHKATTALVKKAAANAAENKPVYKPTHEKEYEYMDGEWLEGGDYNYTYDAKGNILTNTYDDGYSKTRVTSTYNADNLWTEQVTETAEDGGDFVNSERKTRQYDPVVKDLVVELRSYMWNGTDWYAMGNANKRDVSRDAGGKVTSVVISTWYDNQFSPVERTTVAYDDLGLTGTWTHETINSDNQWEESQVLKDMEWLSTDNQVVTNDYMELFQGNNRLKKATAWNGGLKTGTILAKYDETGATQDRTIALTYTPREGYDDILSGDTITYKYEGQYGSYTATQKYYHDDNEDGKLTADELSITNVAKVVFDEHGNNTLVENYENGELKSGTKNEYKYDPATGAQAEWVTYEYNYYTKAYEPFVKIVSDQYVEITAGINDAKADATAYKSGVYNLQGVKVAENLDGKLPQGIYIFKGKKVKR